MIPLFSRKMLNTLASVTKWLKPVKSIIDGAVFDLNSRKTFLLLLACASIVFSGDLFAKEIVCVANFDIVITKV